MNDKKSDSAEDALNLLISLMARLRDPVNGCAWDLKQTFSTLAKYTIEEAYEVAEAIEKRNTNELIDELGDLLLQIVFYSQIAEEKGLFNFTKIANGIAQKLIRRHPHIFDDAKYDDIEDIVNNWEKIKISENKRKNAKDNSILNSIPNAIPSLLRSDKITKRVSQVGFDWENIKGNLNKIDEELLEVKNAIEEKNKKSIEEELGDLLFTIANLCRKLGYDSENTLRLANKKFEQRFRKMELLLKKDGYVTEKTSNETLESYWNKVKLSN